MDDFQKRMIEKSNEVDKRFHDFNLLHKQIEYQKDLQNKEFFSSRDFTISIKSNPF